MESINTEGVVSVGEINTRLMREAQVEQDYTNAWVAGAKFAYEEAMRFAEQRIAAAGQYDDTRALQEFESWAADRIKAVHANPMNGIDDGLQS